MFLLFTFIFSFAAVISSLIFSGFVFGIGSNLSSISFITNDGETWFAPMKFITDALTLELDKVPSNKVLEDAYHLWYIAKSYNDGYNDVKNLPFGEHHAREYARRCIFYYEMYLNQNRLSQ